MTAGAGTPDFFTSSLNFFELDQSCHLREKRTRSRRKKKKMSGDGGDHDTYDGNKHDRCEVKTIVTLYYLHEYLASVWNFFLERGQIQMRRAGS